MEYLPVVMNRENLQNIPQVPLPEGYTVRAYRQGDRETWIRIWQAAEPFIKITGETFDSNFGGDLPAMPKRCLFIVAPEGSDVATITAWYDRNYRGRPWGRIHWVAVAPEHQGKCLSRGMMTLAMNRLRALGHRRATLGTQTPRLAAIRTYLRFGFVPDMTAKDAARAWGLVAKEIDHPALRRL